MTAVHCNLLDFNKNVDLAFVSAGFCNWRKASESFRKHETCQTHSKALLNLSRKQNIASQLDNAYKREDKLCREAFMKHLPSLRYLSRQGLPIRGHDPSEGNLFQYLQHCEDDPQLCVWLHDKKNFLPEIVN